MSHETLVVGLNRHEENRARDFLNSLPKEDLKNLQKVLMSVSDAARDYLNSCEPQDNFSHFCKGSIFEGIEEKGYPFFLVFLTGGNLTKTGPRPDIDLVIAHNARWKTGFANPGSDFEHPYTNFEPVFQNLWDLFSRDPQKVILTSEELPDDYNIGETRGVALITINPSEGRPIHIKYIRSFGGDREGYRFISETDFLSRDIDKKGSELPRLTFLRLEGLRVDLPKLTW